MCRSLDTLAAEAKRRARGRGGDVGDGALVSGPATNLKDCRYCMYRARKYGLYVVW